jgi:hypothetical protein
MNLEKLLAENMLRFGVKNLSESDKKQILEQATQTIAQNNAQGINDLNQRERAVAALKDAIRDNKSKARCIFYKTFKKTAASVPMQPINAQFYNNMVSLDKGILSIGDVTKQVDEIIAAIQDQQLSDVTITVEGTATNAKPYMSGYDQNKRPMPLDHPGQPYGGVDIESDPQAGNEYLAQQRANSIISIFKQKLPDAKYVATSKILQGDFSADALRRINVTVVGQRKTRDPIITGTPIAQWQVSYTESTATNTADTISKANTGGAYELNDTSKTYQARVSFKFGIDANGLVGNYNWTNLKGQGEANVPGDKTGTRINYPYLVNGVDPGSTSGQQPGTPPWDFFLKSCGRFTTEQVKSLQDGIKVVSSPIFKALAKKGNGDLNDLSAILGGSPKTLYDTEHASGALMVDATIEPNTFTVIGK